MSKMIIHRANRSVTSLMGVAQLHKKIQASVTARTMGVDDKLGRLSMESENLSESDIVLVDSAMASMSDQLRKLAVESDLSLGGAAVTAATVGGMAAADMGAYARTNINPANAGIPGNVPVVHMPVTDARRERYAVEAFDQRDTRNAVVNTIAYNAGVAMQDAFGNAFFRTVVLGSEQAGLLASLPLFEVGREITHEANGSLTDFKRRNLIQAAIDETILSDDSTDAVPVVRTSGAVNTEFFAPAALVAAHTVSVHGEDVVTAPLLMGKTFSLASLCQTDAQLARGKRNQTDALDTDIRLAKLYLSVTNTAGDVTEVIPFETTHLRGAAANYKVQGSYREMTFNLTTKLSISKDTKLSSGAASTLLANAVTNPGLVAQIAVRVYGDINVEYTSGSVIAGDILVERVFIEATGADATVAQVNAVKAALANAKFFSFDLKARFINSNRREVGDLVTNNEYRQFYPVPQRAPITAQLPSTTGDEIDATLVAMLSATTHTRASQDAVTTLLAFDSLLSQVKVDDATIGLDPTALGLGNMLVRPYYEFAEINAATDLDSTTSLNRAEEINKLVINKIRDMVYRAYRVCGIKPAADQLAGGEALLPQVIVGGDLELIRWLQLDGEFSTIGRNFTVKVVGSPARRMKGLLFVTFDQPGAVDGAWNPLGPGHMLYRPECVYTLPAARQGTNIRELTVAPSYVHVPNLPVLMKLAITGITDVISSKVTINVSQ